MVENRYLSFIFLCIIFLKNLLLLKSVKVFWTLHKIVCICKNCIKWSLYLSRASSVVLRMTLSNMQQNCMLFSALIPRLGQSSDLKWKNFSRIWMTKYVNLKLLTFLVQSWVHVLVVKSIGNFRSVFFCSIYVKMLKQKENMSYPCYCHVFTTISIMF